MSTASMAHHAPTESEISSIAADIRKASPQLGIAKVLLEIKQRQPTWMLSEKAPPFPPQILTISV